MFNQFFAIIEPEKIPDHTFIIRSNGNFHSILIFYTKPKTGVNIQCQ